MRTVILDTSFLVDLIKFKVDLDEIGELIDEPYRLITVDKVVKELKKLSRKDKNASTALKLLVGENVEVVSSKGADTDSALLILAKKGTMVATDDRQLRKRLKEKGIQTIYVKGKKYLGIS